MQASVESPDSCTLSQFRRCKKVRVDVANAVPEKACIDEIQHFLVRRDDRLRQILQGLQDDAARLKMTECKLANNERMREDFLRLKQLRQRGIAASEVIHPNRRISQNHFCGIRRRGAAFSRRWLPPKRAKRRAASRSINALSASRTSADFSFNPVNS